MALNAVKEWDSEFHSFAVFKSYFNAFAYTLCCGHSK